MTLSINDRAYFKNLGKYLSKRISTYCWWSELSLKHRNIYSVKIQTLYPLIPSELSNCISGKFLVLSCLLEFFELLWKGIEMKVIKWNFEEISSTVMNADKQDFKLIDRQTCQNVFQTRKIIFFSVCFPVMNDLQFNSWMPLHLGDLS